MKQIKSVAPAEASIAAVDSNAPLPEQLRDWAQWARTYPRTAHRIFPATP